MYASKENAHRAYQTYARLMERAGSEEFSQEDLKQVADFLVAAERSLPTEAAYRRQKPRRRTKLANG